MRNLCCVWLLVFVFGTWTGPWERAGSSGGFELTLEKDKLVGPIH